MDDGKYGELTLHFSTGRGRRIEPEGSPHDWAAFLRQRLDACERRTQLTAGVARGGYRLVFTDTASDLYKSTEERAKVGRAHLLSRLERREGREGQGGALE